MYGPDVRKKGTYAHNCLLARRLIERGVRFVQLMHSGWDQHSNLDTQLALQCRDTDQPSAALVKDLKQRGLLDDTIVLWCANLVAPFSFKATLRNQAAMAEITLEPAIAYGWLGWIQGRHDSWRNRRICYKIVKDPVGVHDCRPQSCTNSASTTSA